MRKSETETSDNIPFTEIHSILSYQYSNCECRHLTRYHLMTAQITSGTKTSHQIPPYNNTNTIWDQQPQSENNTLTTKLHNITCLGLPVNSAGFPRGFNLFCFPLFVIILLCVPKPPPPPSRALPPSLFAHKVWGAGDHKDMLN